MIRRIGAHSIGPLLIAAMTDNLQKYEAKYGVVDAGDPTLPVH